MTVFVDTSAILAVINRNDLWAVRAAKAWTELINDDHDLVTTSYVVLETVSVLQRRLGMDSVKAFIDKMVPVMDVEHVDANLHEAALSSFLTASVRDLSLVDCCGFEVIRRRSLSAVFAYDRHFEEQGFTIFGGGVEATL